MHFWKNNPSYTPSYAWLCGLLTGVLCFFIGLAQGQLSVIWQKAVMICLECIGIG